MGGDRRPGQLEQREGWWNSTSVTGYGEKKVRHIKIFHVESSGTSLPGRRNRFRMDSAERGQLPQNLMFNREVEEWNEKA